MDVNKAKRFNEKMGKAKHYPRHQNLAKGGMVDRKHLAIGGDIFNDPQVQQVQAQARAQAAAQPAAPGNPVGGNTQQGGLIGGLTQQSEYQAKLAPVVNANVQPGINAGFAAATNTQPVNQAMAAEQGLASQYGNIAAGRGPNPALAALNQQTGANVANTAALQAGQRGGAGNVGLLARQIGQQGAATQQNAVGQAATLQANQQLGALGAQGALQGQIAQQGLGQQGIGAGLYGQALNTGVAQNNTNIANYGQAQAINAATAQANTDAANKTQGGLLGGIGAAAHSILGLHSGGEVQHLAMGGGLGVDTSFTPTLPGVVQPIAPLTGPTLQVAPMAGAPMAPAAAGPVLGADTALRLPEQPMVGNKSVGSFVDAALGGGKDRDKDPTGMKGLGGGLGDIVHHFSMANGGAVAQGPHGSHAANYLFAEGGPVGDKVPALVSAQEVYLNPHQVKEVVERGADPMRIGHHFPGKDKVSHNSEKNDVIPVDLDDGGVVLPIDITTHKDASEKGRKFVQRAHAKRYMKKPKGI